jgi:glycine cleavage system H protein
MTERFYTETHEWVTLDGEIATIGITDYAQAKLGDVVFLDLPEPGRQLSVGESLGAVESVKAASDIYAPVAGTVIEVNQNLASAPEKVNQDPYGDGWLVKLRVAGALPELLDEERYGALIREAEA